jgi:hypothetical protein
MILPMPGITLAQTTVSRAISVSSQSRNCATGRFSGAPAIGSGSTNQ